MWTMLSRWREQYDRVMRWHARITEATVVDERHLDDFHAFFIRCLHLKDWLKADRTLADAVKRGAEELVNTDEWLRLCADVANGSKHLRIDRERLDAYAHLDKTEWVIEDAERGVTSVSLAVVRADPIGEWLALTVANKCAAAWEAFLRERRLLGP